MSAGKVYRAIGLMSGTSLDGAIDVALIETDGENHVKSLKYYAHPYDSSVRDKVRACFGKTEPDAQTEEAEKLVTDLHIAALQEFGEEADIIGFHGQTIHHDPARRFTWQLGCRKTLQDAVGIEVAPNLRQLDIDQGGQGAPLLPPYHRALLAGEEQPVAVLNIGGVSNITYIDDAVGFIGFDCGPGNALMDDFIKARTGAEYDSDGAAAKSGAVDQDILAAFLADPYFTQAPPKSLDRDHWSAVLVKDLSTEDGMATLLAMTAESVCKSFDYLPANPNKIYASGGGRKNAFLVQSLAERSGVAVEDIDALGCNGDAIEAEGFAYLAVRALLNLPLLSHAA